MAGSPAWFATAGPETIAAYYRKRCVSYGFQAGTPQMAQCIQSEASGGRSRAADSSARSDAMIAESLKPRPAPSYPRTSNT